MQKKILFSKNLLQYNLHKKEDKNKMKNYRKVKRKYLKNLIRLIIIKSKIIMNIFLKKIIKKNLPLSYHHNNQYNKILKLIKIIVQKFKIIIFKLI